MNDSNLLNHGGHKGSQSGRDRSVLRGLLCLPWLRNTLAALAIAAFPLAAGAQQANPQATAPKPPDEEQQKAQPWKEIPIPPLPAFHPQEPRRIALPNGMVVFLQEDHELPVIGGTAMIRGGAKLEPANKAGMLDIYGEAWRTGGTSKRTGDELDDFLEARAAKVETDAGAESTAVSFSCLKQDFSDVFAVFLEVLREPAFRDDKIALAKREMDTGISRRNENSADIAGRESVKLAYGRNNPYARTAEYATVAAVTRQDLLDFHRRFVHPNNVIFGVYGDFDGAQMEARLRQAFESWAKGPQAEEPKIEFTAFIL
jgi:zinc protease